MDTKADRYGYLRKTGAIGVCTKAVSVSGSTRGKGSLGSASTETTGLAKKANIEGNESAMYEKLEKRSLKSLKEGGSEKELRRGHNLSMGDMTGGLSSLLGGSSGPSAAQLRTQKRVANVGKVAKSNVGVNASLNPVLAARVANRQAIKSARGVDQQGASGTVKAAKAVGRQNIQAAKKERAAFTPAQAKESKTSFVDTLKSARQNLRGAMTPGKTRKNPRM